MSDIVIHNATYPPVLPKMQTIDISYNEAYSRRLGTYFNYPEQAITEFENMVTTDSGNGMSIGPDTVVAQGSGDNWYWGVFGIPTENRGTGASGNMPPDTDDPRYIMSVTINGYMGAQDGSGNSITIADTIQAPTRAIQLMSLYIADYDNRIHGNPPVTFTTCFSTTSHPDGVCVPMGMVCAKWEYEIYTPIYDPNTGDITGYTVTTDSIVQHYDSVRYSTFVAFETGGTYGAKSNTTLTEIETLHSDE